MRTRCCATAVSSERWFKIMKIVKEIKQEFRLLMNGVASQSMREKGAETGYHLNWGVSLPHLREMAQEIGKDYDLAIALWKENVRECKILATMVMPAEKMLPEVVDIWMEQTVGQEMAEMASFNLYQHLPFAAEKAYGWMASDKPLYQLCGFLVIARLFMNGQTPNERGINEFVDQAITAMLDGEMMVRKAAMQSLLRFADLGLVYERIAQSAAKKAGLDII